MAHFRETEQFQKIALMLLTFWPQEYKKLWAKTNRIKERNPKQKEIMEVFQNYCELHRIASGHSNIPTSDFAEEVLIFKEKREEKTLPKPKGNPNQTTLLFNENTNSRTLAGNSTEWTHLVTGNLGR